MEKKYDIQEELIDIAPILSQGVKLKKGAPSQDYFDQLQLKVMAEIEGQKTMESGPLADYFDTLPNSVIDQLKSKPTFRLINLAYSLAAVLVLTVAALFLFNNQPQIEDNSMQYTSFVDDLEDEEMMYLLAELSTTTDIALFSQESTEESILPAIDSDTDSDLLQYMNELELMQSIDL